MLVTSHFFVYICAMAELIPKRHIKTYHTLYDVKEYYIDAMNRVVIHTHLHNGKQYVESININKFVETNDNEIGELISEFL